MDVETFYLIEVPGGDRRYIDRKMTPEKYKRLKAEKKGTRIFKVYVKIPAVEKNHDEAISAEAQGPLTL